MNEPQLPACDETCSIREKDAGPMFSSFGSVRNLLAFTIAETNTRDRFIKIMIDLDRCQICKEFWSIYIPVVVTRGTNTRTGNFHFSSSFFFDQTIGVSRFRGGWLDNEWNDPSPLDIFDPQIRFFLPPFSSQPQDREPLSRPLFKRGNERRGQLANKEWKEGERERFRSYLPSILSIITFHNRVFLSH